jgi:hypothetical protein
MSGGMYCSSIRLRVDPDVRSEIEDNQQKLIGLQLPENFIYTNGRSLTAASLNPFVYCSLSPLSMCAPPMVASPPH